jgi:hypothetical protein
MAQSQSHCIWVTVLPIIIAWALGTFGDDLSEGSARDAGLLTHIWIGLPFCCSWQCGYPGVLQILGQRSRQSAGFRAGFWKSVIAGLCGTIAHTLLIPLKIHVGWLPSFQPYEALQKTLSQLIGGNVPPIIPWAISYLNGMTIVALLFGSSYKLLPGKHGITKGLSVGVLVWLIMGLVFFPLVGLGFFARDVRLGFKPALFSLTMVETYSLVMGTVFAVLNRET